MGKTQGDTEKERRTCQNPKCGQSNVIIFQVVAGKVQDGSCPVCRSKILYVQRL